MRMDAYERSVKCFDETADNRTESMNGQQVSLMKETSQKR